MVLYSRTTPSMSKILIYASLTFIPLFLFFQIKTLSDSRLGALNKTCFGEEEMKNMASKIRDSVTFLPLKDLRYADKASEGHSWFMSSLYDAPVNEDEEAPYLKLPSQASKGRVLCLKGRNSHDGSWNSYALAWPDDLPKNSTMMKGKTFIVQEHFTFGNMWHAMSAVVPFVGWYLNNQCSLPERWILYVNGAFSSSIFPWVKTIMEATFDGHFKIENFESVYGNISTTSGSDDDDASACFEDALVMRHYQGRMTNENRIKTYDMIRCKARMYCNVTSDERSKSEIGMTVLMRLKTRSFKNSSAVIDIFRESCEKVKGCHLMVETADNLTVCEQVKLMSQTDILVTPHGAQLTNLILMDKNGSILELFPYGWLEHVSDGVYPFHWLASSVGMKTHDTWWDPIGDECSPSEDSQECASIVKSREIGHNESYFSEWAEKVLGEVKLMEEENSGSMTQHCGCNSEMGLDQPSIPSTVGR